MSKNPGKKDFRDSNKGLTSPPTIHETITAGTAVVYADGEAPRRFWCKAAGTIVLKDAAGTSASYPVLASQPFVFENATELEATTDIDVIAQW